MQAGRKRTLFGAAIALVVFIADAPAAMAQLVQSDVESETPTPETSQLVTSSTEVRRAVIGLIALAVVVALLGFWYWYKTGKQAADRHAHKYGGRHHGGPNAAPQAAAAPASAAAHAAGVPPSTAAPAGAAAQGAAQPGRVSPAGPATAPDTGATPGQSALARSLMADQGMAGAAGFGAGFGGASPQTMATPSNSVFSPSSSFGQRSQSPASTASVYDPPMSVSTWSTGPEPLPGGTSTAMSAAGLPAMPTQSRALPSHAPAPMPGAGPTPSAPAPAATRGSTHIAGSAPSAAAPAARTPASPERPRWGEPDAPRKPQAVDRSPSPELRAASPYPDGAAPGARQASEGRWATLRRDLFG